jgi:lysophospholipase L1-like esterase
MASPPRRGGELSLLAGSLAFSLVLGEVAVRCVAPQGLPSQTEIRGYVIRGMYVADARAGYRLTPGFSGRLERREHVTDFSVNAAGLRGGEIGPKSKRRVLALGDSMTWGWGVSQGEEWIHAAAREVARLGGPEIESLNGGVNGYGTANELARLEELGPELSPDLVLVGFFINDFADNLLGATGAYAVRDGYLFDLASQQTFREDWLTRRSHLWRLATAAWETYRVRYAGGMPDARPGRRLTAHEVRDSMELSLECFRRMATVTRSLGARLGVVWLPPLAYTLAGFRPEHIPLQSELQRRVAAAGIDSLDLLPTFEAQPAREGLYIPGDGHFSARGHRVAGEAVGDWIVAARLVPAEAR